MRLKGGVCCALQYERGGGSVRQFESGWPSLGVCARARAWCVCEAGGRWWRRYGREGLGPYRGELNRETWPSRAAVCLSTVSGSLEEGVYLQPVNEMWQTYLKEEAGSGESMQVQQCVALLRRGVRGCRGMLGWAC